ncbi:MAG: 2-methylcitrate dehydratase [Proteobacteria bacterium]|nr:2-methylcitrate dehydratase [Burkholderiales bacterium]
MGTSAAGAASAASTPAPDALLREIAEYVVDYRLRDTASLDAARLSLFDTLACAIEALGQPACRRLLGPIVPGTVVPNGARLPGTTHVLDPAKATFDLGCMIRWLDYNDACSGALTIHPSDAWAGVLMLGDYLSRGRAVAGAEPLRMSDMLDAGIRVYEIQGALCAHNDFRAHGIDQPLLARVAVAAVATGMLGGSADQVMNAVSNAFVETTLLAIRHAPNIGSRKNWATAQASEAGVRLAMMAMQGEDGYPWILSAKALGFHDSRFGGDALRLDGALGEGVIGRCMFKLVPAGMHGQTAGECAFVLHPRVVSRVDEIEHIALHCHRSLARIMDKPGALRNSADRDHCVQYIVAVGLLHGRIGPDDYSDAFAAADPRIDGLRARMTLREDPRYTDGFFDPARRSSANAVEVFFRDGTTSGRVEREYPLGHPRRRGEALPALRDKFEHAMRGTPAPRREQLLALRDDPDALDRMPVHEFIDGLADPWRAC